MAQFYIPLLAPGDRVEVNTSNGRPAYFGTVIDVCFPSVTVCTDCGCTLVTPILVWDFEIPF